MARARSCASPVASLALARARVVPTPPPSRAALASRPAARSVKLVVSAVAASGRSPSGLSPLPALRDLAKLTRAWNLVPSLALVLVGALGSTHSFSVVQRASVWAMGLISAGISLGSMAINDYLDLPIDQTNAPDKPLPSGRVSSEAALLLAGLLYCGCLCAACLMEPPGLRAVVAFSAAATLAYTPLFKRLTGIKNATVAAVIALAPIAGALAAGAGDAGLAKLLPATLWAFSAVMFREIVMDCSDMAGDRAAGVWTLPVVYGQPAALAAALTFLLAGTAAAMARAAALAATGGSSLAAWLAGAQSLPAPWAQLLAVGAPVAVLAVASGRLVQLACGAWAAGFTPAALSYVVDRVLQPAGLTIILLAAIC